MMRRIKTSWNRLANPHKLATPFVEPKATLNNLTDIGVDAFPDFLDQIGAVGMGGSGFSTAQKLRAASGAHTLIINGIECEPGITIDQAVLLNHSQWVKVGAEACAKAIGARKIILAVKKRRRQCAALRKLYPSFQLVPFPDRYPAGAEKLILKKLTRRMPPPGTRPHQLGYLVLNVVTLRAIGRALLDGIAVVERPLTLAMPSQKFHANIIAPVGHSIGKLFSSFKIPYDAERHQIISSGLMMGYEVFPSDRIEKTTTSLILLERKTLETKERDCIRCGACNTACPLDLHPYTLIEAIRHGQATSETTQTQLNECFLCGACSAVCPSHIPLVPTLMEGKRCQP